MKTSTFQNKVRIIFCFIVLFSLIMVVRLYFLQIVYGTNYSDKADRQYVNVSVDTYDRGSIFFKDKNGDLLSAASLKTGYILAINNKLIATDTEEYYKKISAIIPLDAGDFYSKTAKVNDPYEVLAKEISADDIKKISDLNLTGLVISKENWRYYPGDSLAANIIGLTGYDDSGTNIEGRYGLEKYYDDNLNRSNGDMYVNTFAEIFSTIKNNFIDQSAREADIVTSIDPEVQGYVEKEIAATNNKWHSKTTGAIIIDPNTGDIYAMASYPTFNPNDFKNETDVGVFGDPLVSNAYEMGSIIKPLTMAVGLDTGVVTSASTYNDTGFLKVDGSTIHNYDGKARGVINMQQVLNQSLNVGASYVATQIGKKDFLKYFQAYGIGSETGIDLPNEAAGNISNLLNNLNNTKQVEYDTASFGQGISMTPIITTSALSVLANGGKLIIPHVVTEINYKVGLPKNIDYASEAKQVLKKSTSEEISRMLVGVVDTALAHGARKMDHYSIAAKTGTAQIARPASEGGGYYPDKYLHSFFGYFPAYNPRFLVFIYTFEPADKTNPQADEYASQTLTDPFFNITHFLINYYQIPPDR
jgi:stage V sporulation protein D (sporulation-specific penicillin-binding protein)